MSQNQQETYTAIDLFSGCGGLSVGLQNAGFNVVAAVENEPLASSTYRRNHNQTILLENDIKNVKPTVLMRQLGMKPGELSMLAGCPPCQGFSTLRTLNGGKSIKEPMNDLIFQFLKFVNAFLPKAIMMENVPGLIRDPRIEKFKSKIAKLGYQSEARVLDAAEYGTPQRRKRMVLIALRGKSPNFGEGIKYKKTVRWAFSKLEGRDRSDDPLHTYQSRRSEHVLKLIKKIPFDGGSRTDLPYEDQLPCHKKCNGFKDIYGRMSWSKPAPTITGGCINPSKGRFLHPEEHRAITLREASVLQGFPVNYEFDTSKGRFPVAQLIGNAFPPKFAETHARRILQDITA